MTFLCSHIFFPIFILNNKFNRYFFMFILCLFLLYINFQQYFDSILNMLNTRLVFSPNDEHVCNNKVRISCNDNILFFIALSRMMIPYDCFYFFFNHYDCMSLIALSLVWWMIKILSKIFNKFELWNLELGYKEP